MKIKNLLRTTFVALAIGVAFSADASAHPTYVPHESALDIVDGESNFDVTIVPVRTYYHDEFPKEIIVPLLCQMDLYSSTLDVTISGPESVESGGSILSRASVSGGSSSYQYDWQYMPQCPHESSVVDLEVHCGEWRHGGTASSFEFTPDRKYTPIDIKVSVKDTECSRVASQTASKRVYVEPDLDLEGAYPNPFNPTTTIRFSVPDPTAVTITVYDISGREVRRLADRVFAAGVHEVRFDASGVPSGVYYYVVRTKEHSVTRSVLLLK